MGGTISKPVCIACEKPVSPLDHVEVTPLRVLMGHSTPIGTHLYHPECFFEEREEEENLDQAKSDKKEAQETERKEG